MRGNKKSKDRYRFDNRSKQQFSRDIRDSSKIELLILELWLDRIEESTGKRPTYQGNGCGPDGEFLSAKNVNSDADYHVDGHGLIEIKFAKPLLPQHFHLKVDQVKSYLNQDASILMVHGWETKSPQYVLIPAKLLRGMLKKLEVVSWVGFGGKMAYRLPMDKFVWRDLKCST